MALGSTHFRMVDVLFFSLISCQLSPYYLCSPIFSVICSQLYPSLVGFIPCPHLGYLHNVVKLHKQLQLPPTYLKKSISHSS